MYVVAGVTGQTGRAVAQALLEQGKPVTVIVRTEEKGRAWRSKGAKVAVAALEDAAVLQGVLAGTEGAYLLVPPNYGAETYMEDRCRIADALAQAVGQSGVPHVVFLSSIGAQLASGTGPILVNRYGESVLTPVARNLTLLRPPYFIENWAGMLSGAKEKGVLPSFLHSQRKIPMIATKDIGRIAAESLLNPAHGCRIIEMAGPQEYSPEDIAQALGTLLRREVRVEPLPSSAVVPTFKSFGVSEDLARLFEEMYVGINSGHIGFQVSGTEFWRGTVSAAEVLSGLLKQ